VKALLAEFDSSDALVAAVRRLQAEGYTRLDAYTPFPLDEITELLGGPTARIGWIAAISAIVGGALTYALVWWSAAIDYPLNVGGRPLHSWPAFLPSVVVAAALWSGLATLIGMLRLAGLPRWHQPLFDVRRFDRVTYDRFVLAVGADDPRFGDTSTPALLRSLGAGSVEEFAP
jgi:hypothetical protein